MIVPRHVNQGEVFPYDVFLSYPSNERRWVRALIRELERRAIAFFLDEKDIQPGKNFVLALGEALQRSRFLVLILSRESASRPWVQQEWTAFTALHGPTDRILPVLLEPAEIPALLSPIQVIHAVDRNAARVAKAIGVRVQEASSGVSYSTLVSRRQGDLAAQLALSQASRFLGIRRYPLQDIDKIPIGDALALYADEKAGAEEEHYRRIPISKLVEMHRASILIGEPGAGKSTGLQQLTHDQAQAYLAGSHSLPPLYIDLKWWSKELHRLLESTIFDLCPNVDAATVSQFVSTAPISYYLDGFDEAQNPAQLLREIKTLASQNQGSRFLIASRPNDLLGNLDFAAYELAPLNRAQIREILELYLARHLDADHIWRIYQDIEQYGLFADLGNPMMLWFFSLAIREAGSVERIEFLAKGKVFSRVVENYFLSTWEPKSLKPWTALSRRYALIKTELLSKIARKMIEKDDKTVVPEQWVFDEFVADLVGQYPNPSELGHELLDQIICHHLLERNAERLTFWHKSLRNFFAARSLAGEKNLPSLASLAREVRWHETIIMLASLDSRFGKVVKDVASANPIVGLDCVTFSQLSQDPVIVESVVHTALKAFLSKRPLEERVRIIQRFAALYRRVPDLLSEVTYSFLYRERQVGLMKREYKSLISRAPIFEKIVRQLREALVEAEIEAKIETRIKTLASCVRKACKRKQDVKNIYDVFGIRLITNDEVRYCYAMLGLVHNLWRPVPGYIKDYIAVPKPNMYRAIHTTLMVDDLLVEVIIQTAEMHEFSKQTWSTYRDSKYGDVLEELEVRQTMATGQEVPVRSYVHGDNKIVVFTPQDGLVLLEEDATVLDCAYYIHSEIFKHCEGAIVNGKRVHIGHPLKNLDHVKILADSDIQPEERWLSLVRSIAARKALGRILRQRERAETLISGRALVDAYLMDVSAKTGATTETIAKMIMRRLGCHKFDDLCRGVASGKYSLPSGASGIG